MNLTLFWKTFWCCCLLVYLGPSKPKNPTQSKVGIQLLVLTEIRLMRDGLSVLFYGPHNYVSTAGLHHTSDFYGCTKPISKRQCFYKKKFLPISSTSCSLSFLLQCTEITIVVMLTLG